MKARILSIICTLLATASVAQGRSWYAREVGCWITQEKVPASWEDARRSCELDGAVLASPLNLQLFDYMQTLINVHNHTVAYFIGTRANRPDNGRKVQYLSVEGRRLDDMPQAVFDAIEQLDLKQGDCLSMNRYGIQAVACWEQLPYMCYWNETTECDSAPMPIRTTSSIVSTTSTTIRPPHITTSLPTNTTSSTPPPSTTMASAEFGDLLNSSAPVSEVCLKCFCHVFSGCKQVGCGGGVCGPYHITNAYWIDAGKPTYNREAVDSSTAYSNCTTDLHCAATTIQGYMTRFGQDCNGDGVVNCYDYLAIHMLGGYGCTRELPHRYVSVLNQCFATQQG